MRYLSVMKSALPSCLLCGCFSFLAGLTPTAQAASALGAFNVDPSTVAVAGISSGGFMAVQLQVAYSKSINGTAVFAGGPYDCIVGDPTNATGNCLSGIGLPVQTMIDFTNTQASNGTIDPVNNIANKPIYMFSGTIDTTVHQPVMNALQQYYLKFTSSSNITFNNNTPAAHAWISPDGPNSCSLSFIPYISSCGIDPEQTFLTLFYGNLNAKNTGALGGNFIQFDQAAFVSGGNPGSISMDNTGWVFVPAACANGQACRLVVALHGCLQYQGIIQDKFVRESGINEWADTNNIIVLYPQATTMGLANPLGCWDWFAYTGSNFVLKSAPQMQAIMGMVSQITSGNKGSVSIPATPTGLTGTTISSVGLTFSASATATSYNVFRNGSKVGSTSSNSFTDSGLTANTTYTYTVTAVNSSGESAQSSPVSATPCGPPTH